MKNNEKLADLIGKCDDKFIELSKAEVTPVAKRRISFMPFVAAAACVCFLGGGIYIYSRANDIKGGEGTSVNSEGDVLEWQSVSSDSEIGESETVSENYIYEIPKWDEMEIYQQFPWITHNGIDYTAAGKSEALTQDDIGECLGSVSAENTDVYTDITYEKGFSYYEINSIDSDYAIAVYFPELSNYHVYTNSSYETATFGDLAGGLNLEEHMRFDALYLDTNDGMTASHCAVDLSNNDTSVIWEFLRSCADAESMGDYIEFSDSVFRENSDILDSHLDFAVYSDILGFGNLSFCFTKGGYITTNITSTGRAFYIGTDKVNELITLLEEQGIAIGENGSLGIAVPPVSDADLTTIEMWESLAGYWNSESSRFCRFEAAVAGGNAATFATAFWESEWGDDNGEVIELKYSGTNELTASIALNDQVSDTETAHVIIDYSELNSNGIIYINYDGQDLGAFTFAGETMDDAFAAYAGEGASSTSLTLPYNPPTENTDVYLIAEFAQQMGKTPLLLSQDDAASILRKISAFSLTEISDVDSIDFPTGGGYLINVEGDREQSFNIIGEDYLCIDGEYYYSIESDVTELIDEIVGLLAEAEQTSSTYYGSPDADSASATGIYQLEPLRTIVDFPPRVYYLD